MKIKNNTIDKVPTQENRLSRKEALKKVGKYAAFTAAGMMILLKPSRAYAGSTPTNPGEGW